MIFGEHKNKCVQGNIKHEKNALPSGVSDAVGSGDREGLSLGKGKAAQVSFISLQWIWISSIRIHPLLFSMPPSSPVIFLS